MTAINPNSDRDYLDKCDLSDEKIFPKFLKTIKFCPFRNITSLKISFIHPITVITGSNKIGKSTILMAIACSYYNFQRRNPSNGRLERQTWSNIALFTKFDKQKEDWNYWIEYKLGNKNEPAKRGQRKKETNKWNGIAKKEGQIKDRQVIFIDLERIVPLRNITKTLFWKVKSASEKHITINDERIKEYFSYIFEENYDISLLTRHLDKAVLKFKTTNEYTSYNSASGEDVIARILIDSVEAEKYALILIDELEVGLHPKIQRRLVDILNHISYTDSKQIIVTTHSPTLVSCFSEKSRIFIERNNEEFKAIPKISINAAFSKMDSKAYPLVDLYCEDDMAHWIIKKAIKSIQEDKKIKDFNDLVNVIESGNSNDTYENFKIHKRVYDKKKIKTGYACILDGDMKHKKNKNGNLLYPQEENLLFIISNMAPERYLLTCYLKFSPNPTLEYHKNHSDAHILFNKLVENSCAVDKVSAFELCWDALLKDAEGRNFFNELCDFLLIICQRFSPDL